MIANKKLGTRLLPKPYTYTYCMGVDIIQRLQWSNAPVIVLATHVSHDGRIMQEVRTPHPRNPMLPSAIPILNVMLKTPVW